MAARVLSIENIAAAPFRSDVEAAIRSGLKPLVDSGQIKLDLAGKEIDSALYALTFSKDYAWSEVNRFGCKYAPMAYGVTGIVLVEAIQRANGCRDVTRCETCAQLFRNSKDELGQVVISTALHEIGHLFGLRSADAYDGADADGHNGDPANMMFDITKHKDYRPIELDSERTVKYTIVKGDTFPEIARRIGFWPHTTTGLRKLCELKGKDGKRNIELIKSGDINKISPGEQIWIPDVDARVRFQREMDAKPKTFTEQQHAFMLAFVKAGKTID